MHVDVWENFTKHFKLNSADISWSTTNLCELKIVHCFKNEWTLKYQFWKKSLWKNATLSSWTLFQHICPHFWSWLLLYSAITPKSEDKYVVKVFNSTELHISEVYFFQNWYFRMASQMIECYQFCQASLFIFGSSYFFEALPKFYRNDFKHNSHVQYARHYNPLLIRNCSWILFNHV